MSLIKKLQSLNLPQDAVLSLSYSDGTDVFVHNETDVDDALAYTDVVGTFANLIATRGLSVSTAGTDNILEWIREEGYLEEYDRGSDNFSEYLTEVLTENFYEQDFIYSSTERYDHKRGFCTLNANVQVSVSEVISASPILAGWEVSVETENGTLTLEA